MQARPAGPTTGSLPSFSVTAVSWSDPTGVVFLGKAELYVDGTRPPPYMNQTYGFGFDETPNNKANVPCEFSAIPNTAGSTLKFQQVLGPWA